MIKMPLAVILLIHGLIHLLGFVKAFRLAEVKQLTGDISRPSGIAWLAAAFMFAGTAVLLLAGKNWWWMAAAPALALSQALVVMHWKDAKFGTAVNAVVLAAAVLAWGAWSFEAMIAEELKSFRAYRAPAGKTVTKEMLERVPQPVRRWLERSGVPGRDIIQAVRLNQRGEMRTAPGGKWMSVTAEQWVATADPGFIWIADVAAAPGIHLAGRDKYVGGRGHLLIKLLSLVTVADSKGKEIDQGSMLRYLAEIIWYPSAALSGHIRWKALDSRTAEAIMSRGGVTASGIFRFDERGDVVGFEARRYFDRKSGATLEDWLVRIDPGSVKSFNGIRIPVKSSVTWRLKEGDFTWYRLEISDISYNRWRAADYNSGEWGDEEIQVQED